MIHLHLLLNHAPLFGTLVAAALLAAATPRRNATLARAGIVAVVITAVLSIAVFVTGRSAAEAVGRVDGVDQEAIGPHEEAAERFLVAMEVAGGMAVLALVRPGRTTIGAVFAMTLLALVLAGMASQRGGLIRHVELRGVVPDR